MSLPTPNSQPVSPLTSPKLNSEVILQILQYVPRPHLRSVALASREFYERALQAGLRFPRNVLWTNLGNIGFSTWLQKLDVVLRFAANRPAVKVALRILMCPSLDSKGMAALRLNIRILSPWIRRALPHLVRLDMGFPPLLSYEEYDALCAHPANKLRELAFFPKNDMTAVVVPPNLFAGVAPLLRRVVLVLVSELMSTWEPVQAFAGVTHLKITEQRIVMPELPLARLFPALRVLVVDTRDCPGEKAIDLVGLASLHHFALVGDTALLTEESQAMLKSLPVFEHHPTNRNITYYLHAPSAREELCGVAERCGALPFLSFGPRYRDRASWRRTLCPTPDAHPFADIAPLAAHLTSLIIAQAVVGDLVSSPVTLTALRELFVDVSPTSDNADAFDRLGFVKPRVHCPALTQVVLFARGALVVELPADAVVELGRALGMRGCRPALLLAGCMWDDWFSTPRASTALRHLFSSVETAGSVAELVPEYYRTCRYSGHFESHQWE